MKNTQKHTQGPWRSNCPQITAQGDMALTVAVVLSCEDNNARADSAAKTKGEAEANARLIAAAPDLLAALKGLMQCAVKDAEKYAQNGNEPIWAYISDASDAITKAEGIK